MTLFERLIHFLDFQMTTPELFGGFHIVSIIIAAVVCTLLILFFRDCSDKTFRRIGLVFLILLVVLEVYKQFDFAFEYNNGDPYWDYAWYSFPFQFCSMPMYVLPLVVFLKDGRLRDAAISYMCFCSVLGGLAVFVFPGDVFTTSTLINVQTMVHHGSQIVLGLYSIAYMRKRLSLRFYLSSMPLFAVVLVVAIGLNVAGYHLLQAAGMDDTFNMFYVGPYFECTLPVLSSIYKAVPYPVFLFLYILAVVLGSGIIFFAGKGIVLLSSRKKEKTE